MSFLQRFKNFNKLFKRKPSPMIERLNAIQSELLEAQASIQRLAKLDQNYDLENRLLSSALNGFNQAFWTKDKWNKLLYANKKCLKEVLKVESLKEFRPVFENHSLMDVCKKSEDLVLESGEIKHFIECGFVKGEFIALDTIKSPFFEQGVIIGTIGSGLLITDLIPESARNRNYLFELSLTGYFSEEKLIELFENETDNLV